MTIDSIVDGIVIDHIPAGKAMTIYQYLKLDSVDCSVALLKNVASHKYGKKDIIKLDAVLDLNLDVLGYLAPECTVNIIRDGRNVEKKSLHLPQRLTGVIQCKNPRCITTIEQELTHIFKLSDEQRRIYRCIYCEGKA